MATLSALPADVLLNIVENLSYEPGTQTICSNHFALPQPDTHKVRCKRTLFAFALCSRYFYRICQKLLYRSIAVYSTRHILLLARTLVHRQDLARSVQHLDVYDEDVTYKIDVDLEDSLNDMLQPLYRSIQTMNSRVDKLQPDAGGVAVALLLLLLPNLKWLDIQFASHLKYVSCLMRASVPKLLARSASPVDGEYWNEFGFPPRLSTLWLTPQSSIDIDLSSVLNLPTLRSLSLGSFQPFGSSWTIEQRCSGIHNLELSNCALNEDEICSILRACCELRRFTYRWNQPWSDDDIMNDEWDFGIDIASHIIEGLEPSRDKLEVLEATGTTSLRHDARPLGSLMDFSCMRSLCVPAIMVLNPIAWSLSQHPSQALPRTLKHLHLVDAETVGDRPIESKLLDCFDAHEEFVILTSLTIDWQLESLQSAQPSFRRLEEFCQDWGINFTLNLF